MDRRLLAATVALLAVMGCGRDRGGDGAGVATAPPRSPGLETPTSPADTGSPPAATTPAPPPGRTGIRLHPLPQPLVQACRQAAREAAVLCPRRFPRRTEKPASPVWSQELDFGGGVFGLELGYSAPTDGPPSQNAPARMLHFVVFVAPPGRGYGEVATWRDLGTATFGSRQGHLYFAREEGVHDQHYVFAWREEGRDYQASLHAWDDEGEALALLQALVRALAPPARL